MRCTLIARFLCQHSAMQTAAKASTAAGRRWGLRSLASALCVSLIAYLGAIPLAAADVLPSLVLPVLATIPFVLAGALAWARATGSVDMMRGWRWIAVALFVYATGNVVWYGLDFSGSQPSPPAPQDVFYVAFPILAFIGMLKLAHSRLRRPRERGWLDALVVGSGAFAVGAAFIAAQLDDHVSGVTTGLLVTGGYLLGDLVLLAVAVGVAQGFGWRAPKAWWLLISGLVVFAISDALYAVTTAIGSYVDGTLVDAGWTIGATFIGLAAWLDHPTGRVAAPSAWSTRIGPAVSILAATTVLLIGDNTGVHWLSSAAAFATVVLGVVRMGISVSDADDFAEQLRRAELDPLTGLVNQRGLQSLRLSEAATGALVLFDLDGFSDVNHSLGREAGDVVLVEVADRMRGLVRANDIVARLGGDDFGIVLLGTDATEAVVVAESMIRALEQPISVLATSVNVSACAGVAGIDGGMTALADALRDAGEALAQARDHGVGVVQQFAGSTGERSIERLQLRAELRAAIVDGGSSFVVHYQPIVDMRDERVLAVEALVRWQRGDRLLAPGVFLTEVANIGALGELTAIILERSLAELRTARLPFPVSVNVPPDLINARLIDRVEAALTSTGSTPEHLFLEVLEDSLIRDPETSRGVLEAMRTRGVRVLLDDFGTGWAGFGTLRDLMVDGLKIDSSFVSVMHDDPVAASIVSAVTGVARDLDLLLIYEGIEAPVTIDALRAMPQAYGQGFGLARPMPITDLANWASLRNTRAADRPL